MAQEWVNLVPIKCLCYQEQSQLKRSSDKSLRSCKDTVSEETVGWSVGEADI